MLEDLESASLRHQSTDYLQTESGQGKNGKCPEICYLRSLFKAASTNSNVFVPVMDITKACLLMSNKSCSCTEVFHPYSRLFSV